MFFQLRMVWVQAHLKTSIVHPTRKEVVNRCLLHRSNFTQPSPQVLTLRKHSRRRVCKTCSLSWQSTSQPATLQRLAAKFQVSVSAVAWPSSLTSHRWCPIYLLHKHRKARWFHRASASSLRLAVDPMMATINWTRLQIRCLVSWLRHPQRLHHWLRRTRF